MAKQSAGILLYRSKNGILELFLIHPGGPFWKNKDLGAWSITKGEFTEAEKPLDAAKREFMEETGIALTGDFIELSPVKQKGGKIIHAWAVKGDLDPLLIVSNSFPLEWPPKSGKWQQFPEINKGEWFAIDVAKQKINTAQALLINELQERLR